VEFVIIDTGCGIETAEMPLLFVPFSQANKSVVRRHGGSGLGLSICKKLVALMGGTITVDSKVNVGSSFCVRLPKKQKQFRLVHHLLVSSVRQMSLWLSLFYR